MHRPSVNKAVARGAVAIASTTALLGTALVATSAPASASTSTYTYSGSVVTWTAPQTGLIEVIAVGGGGGGAGASGSGNGGHGAVVTSIEAVTAGEQLRVRVGGAAQVQAVGGSATSITRPNGALVVVAGGGGGAYSTHDGGSGASANSASGGNGAGPAGGMGGNSNVVSGRGGAGGGVPGGAGGTESNVDGATGIVVSASAGGGGGGYWNGGDGGSNPVDDPAGTSSSFSRATTMHSGGGGATAGGGGAGFGGSGGGGYGGGGGGSGFASNSIVSAGGAGGSFAAETGTNSEVSEAVFYPAPYTLNGTEYGRGGTGNVNLGAGVDGLVRINVLPVAPFPVTHVSVSGKAKAKKRTVRWALPSTNIATSVQVVVRQVKGKKRVFKRSVGAHKTTIKLKRKQIINKRKNKSKKYRVIVITKNHYGSSSKAKKNFRLK